MFPPKDFTNRRLKREISHLKATFLISGDAALIFLTFKKKSDSLFVIYAKNYAFLKKKVSQSDARFKSYLNFKNLKNRWEYIGLDTLKGANQ